MASRSRLCEQINGVHLLLRGASHVWCSDTAKAVGNFKVFASRTDLLHLLATHNRLVLLHMGSIPCPFCLG